MSYRISRINDRLQTDTVTSLAKIDTKKKKLQHARR